MSNSLFVKITLPLSMVLVAGCNSVQSERQASVKAPAAKTEPIDNDIAAVNSEGIILSDINADQLSSHPATSIDMQLNKIDSSMPKEASIEPDEQETDPAALFHDKCAQLLSDFVDEQGMVDYTTLRRQRLRLKAVLKEFENLDPNEYKLWPTEDKTAFWLNAYNIQLLRIITYNYPIRSSRILRLYPGWGPDSIRHIKGIWNDYRFLVMDEQFTLSGIERRFFRGEFDDPRIFFAASKASVSGPPLRNEPYYGRRLDDQLDDQVRTFLASPYAIRIDKEHETVCLSSLFQASSYGKEFVAEFATDRKFKDRHPVTQAVLNFITAYVPQDMESFLEVGKYSVKYMKYDWTINDGS
jgi:hypothetical protein